MIPAGYRSRRNHGMSRCYAEYDSYVMPATDKQEKPLEVDLHLEENRLNHRTSEYEQNDLIIRRGQEFLVTVTLNYEFNPATDKLAFTFSVGQKPQESKGTRVHVNISTSNQNSSSKLKQFNWHARIKSSVYRNDHSTIEVLITPKSDAVVGKYEMKVKTFTGPEPSQYVYTHPKPVYILFNAWCKDDQVYMKNEEERQEYVMNETGRVYQGSKRGICGKPWNFGQFEPSCMEASMYLLGISYLQTPGHGNPTKVVRALSALVNNADGDGGVLVGKWEGGYAGGVPPYTWIGSVAILDEFMDNKRAVKFGQCWVFSGVLVTLCRAIGIPCRSVTNFSSAHDTDFSFTIDHHFDCNGRPITGHDDSIWNFHVWNETWMKRPDLPDGYDGWQAVDGTPQEASEGVYRCGPAPVKAVKEGDLYIGPDAGFIFAEVNGDSIEWTVSQCGDLTVSKINTSCVGKNISTKAVGSTDRLDITNLYKYPEGSAKEREVVRKASNFSTRSAELNDAYEHNKGDVDFVYDPKAKANGDVVINLRLTNKSREDRVVKVNFTANASYYTGIPGEELSHCSRNVDLKPGENNTVSWEMPGIDYLNDIDEDALLKVYTMATVKETNQIFTMIETFSVDKPDLEIKVSKKYPSVGERVDVEVKIENPLSIPLTNGTLRLESPGVQKLVTIPLHRNIEPHSYTVERISIAPRFPGKREVIATFNSRQLVSMTGVAHLVIEKKITNGIA